MLHALLLLDRIKTSDLLDANDAFNQASHSASETASGISSSIRIGRLVGVGMCRLRVDAVALGNDRQPAPPPPPRPNAVARAAARSSRRAAPVIHARATAFVRVADDDGRQTLSSTATDPPQKTKPQLDIDFNEQLDKDDVVHFMNLRSAAQHIEAMHGREYLATLSTEELLSHAQVAAPAEAPAS